MIDERLKHLAIIMDGNGRWAKNRGLKRSLGHKEGAKTLENIAVYANEIGIKYLSVYAFSTDNFKRSEEEVEYLMDLFVDMFTKKFKKLVENNIRVVGKSEQSCSVQSRLNDTELKTLLMKEYHLDSTEIHVQTAQLSGALGMI